MIFKENFIKRENLLINIMFRKTNKFSLLQIRASQTRFYGALVLHGRGSDAKRDI
jgi:hypothetical protein